MQTKRITEEFTGPSRIVEIQALLEKEIQLLNGIENRRAEIQREMQAARQDRMLEKIGETVKWIGYRSEKIHVRMLNRNIFVSIRIFFQFLRRTHRDGHLENAAS